MKFDNEMKFRQLTKYNTIHNYAENEAERLVQTSFCFSLKALCKVKPSGQDLHFISIHFGSNLLKAKIHDHFKIIIFK